jgi:hypothetical protein
MLLLLLLLPGLCLYLMAPLLLLLLQCLLFPLLLLLLLVLTVLLLLPLSLGPTLLVLVMLLVPSFLPLVVVLLRASRRSCSSSSSPACPCLVPLPLVHLQLAQPLDRVLVHCIHRLRSTSGCLGGRLQCMQQRGR